MSRQRLQWSIFMVEPAAVGGADHNRRPVVVVSRESANDALPVVTIVPLAGFTANRRIYPNETCLPPEATTLDSPAVLMAHQIRTISKSRLSTRLGSIDDPGLRTAIRTAVRVQLDLDGGSVYPSDSVPGLESGR